MMAGKTNRSARKYRNPEKERNTEKNSKGNRGTSEEQKENSFPILPQNSEIASKSSLGRYMIVDSNSEVEDKIPFQGSRFTLLPPIETRQELTSARPMSPSLISVVSSKSIIGIEKSHSNIGKPIALPPIESSDGLTHKVNTLLKDSYDRQRWEQMEILKPAKRSKTHTVHKDIQRGDSWELLKAEKIRCAELESYEANSLKRDAEWESHQAACVKREQIIRKTLTKKRREREERGRSNRKYGNKRAEL